MAGISSPTSPEKGESKDTASPKAAETKRKAESKKSKSKGDEEKKGAKVIDAKQEGGLEKEVKDEQGAKSDSKTINHTKTPPAAVVPGVASPKNASQAKGEFEDPRPWETASYVSLTKHSDGRQLRTNRILLQTEISEVGPPTIPMNQEGGPDARNAAPTSKYSNSALLLPEQKEDVDYSGYKCGYEGTTNPEGKPHGKGVMVWSDMGRYEGDFIDGCRHGFGEMRWASGDRYVGNWSHDKQYGEGTYYFSSDYGPDKRYQAYEYLPSLPGSVATGEDRPESLGQAPLDAVEADKDSTIGGMSHSDALPEDDMRSVASAELNHRARFPADRPTGEAMETEGGVGAGEEEKSVLSLGMESATEIYQHNNKVDTSEVPSRQAVDSLTGGESVSLESSSIGDGHLFQGDSMYDGSRVRVTVGSGKSYRRDPSTWDFQHSEGNRYLGERNAASQREGMGKYRYKDGSFYDGHWYNDKMHGVGWLTQPRMGMGYAPTSPGGRDEGRTKSPVAAMGQPTLQPPGSPSTKVQKGNLLGDRRADSPPARGRDSGQPFLENRKEALSAIKRAEKLELKSPERSPSPVARYSISPGSPGSPQVMGRVVLRDDYKGDFVEDLKQGQGRMRYADGSVYYGSWWRDMRHGYGEYYYANGDKYTGHWENDLMHTPLIVKETDADQGMYIWNNGDYYKGGFANGKKYGEGRKDIVADGSIMQGHWEYDEFQGYPFTPDLDYEGEYNMTRGSYMYGKKQGFGRKLWQDGTKRIYDGQWDTDRMHGLAHKMINFFGVGSVYEGQLTGNGIPHGHGKMTYPNGDTFNGQFMQGKKHGKGEYRFKDGETRTGEWFHGRGMFRMGDGRKFQSDREVLINYVPKEDVLGDRSGKKNQINSGPRRSTKLSGLTI